LAAAFEQAIQNKSFLFQRTELIACFLPQNASELNSKNFCNFCSTKQNSDVFSSTEWFRMEFQKFASIFVPRTEFQQFFSSAKWFGMEFREFSVPWNSQISVRTNNLFDLFRLPPNYFFSEIPSPTLASRQWIKRASAENSILCQAVGTLLQPAKVPVFACNASITKDSVKPYKLLLQSFQA
jgi:hypothetical protein